MIGELLKVLNLKWAFLKLTLAICNYTKQSYWYGWKTSVGGKLAWATLIF